MAKRHTWNNFLKNTILKTKNLAMQMPLKIGGEFKCSGREDRQFQIIVLKLSYIKLHKILYIWKLWFKILFHLFYFAVTFFLQNATVQLILVSDGSLTFTGFLYGSITWASTIFQPILSSWQCSESGGFHNHPASLDYSFPTLIGSSSNSRKYR